MKKILFIFAIFIALTMTACDDISEIENKSIITACVAISAENTKYGFYISLPSGADGGEEEGSKSGAKYYEFEANNFNSALMEFKKSVSDDVDISHMTLFAANDAYFKNKFLEDEKYISRRISVTSLVDVCMILCTEYELFDCIDSEYDSKASDFTESILTDFDMNLSKLSLAVHNKNFTAKIPVVSLRERGKLRLPEVYTMSYFDSDNGYRAISASDYNSISSADALKDDAVQAIYIKDNKCIVKLKKKSLADLASKYALTNTDIFNIKYIAKKEFLYYNSYLKYFDKLNLADIEFVGDKV